MGRTTTINWTDATWNPWWGCVRVSPGCKFCYAETLAHRWGLDVWGPTTPRRMMSAAYWRKPEQWDHQAAAEGRRVRVFCASMADVFEDRADLEEPRGRLWNLIQRTPNLDWLLLTKRPENIMHLYPPEWPTYDWGAHRPPANVWLMTSTEDQERFRARAWRLAQIPAVVRGLSVEPMLGPIDLSVWGKHIHWVICGGESGPGARPMSLEWARDLRDQCRALGIAFWFKQLGSVLARELGAEGKGEALEDIPEDLRIRELPEAR